MTSQILTICRILEGVRAKNLQAILLFVDFTKAFDSIHRGKMELILLAYILPKETEEAITILYRNTKVKVRSPDGDTEYFDIVAGVLKGDALAPYRLITCLDYVLRTSIDKMREKLKFLPMLTFPSNPTPCNTPPQTTGLASVSSENRLPSSSVESQLTVFFYFKSQSPQAIASGHDVIHIPSLIYYLRFLLWHL